MKALELKVPPVAQVIVTAAAMYGVFKVLPALKFSLAGSTALAVGLAVIGLSSGIRASPNLKKLRPLLIRKHSKKYLA